MTTGYLYHEVFGWHDTGTAAGAGPSNHLTGMQPHQHFEHADTKRRLHELIVVSGLIDSLVRIRPRPATVDELLRVHTSAYVDRIRAESEQPKGGDGGDGVTPFGQGGYEIALLAAGGVIEVVDAVLNRAVDNAYALVRPPGHHAIADMGMGFCLFGNLAIAARHAQAVRGVGRIAVVDWDVHHGNGTQAAFADDPSVLTISLHQDGVFPPDSGSADERGEGAGFGYALNVPLPPGTGDGGYRYAMERVVLPALHRFRPELILVASGFDAGMMDPLARQMVTAGGYRMMAEMLLGAAADLCDGRLAMSHEGGYSPTHVPFCGLAVLEAMSGVKALDDPFPAAMSAPRWTELQPHQQAIIDDVATLVLDIAQE